MNTGRRGFGFEIDKKLHAGAAAWLALNVNARREINESGYSPTLLRELNPHQGAFAL
jgi:hypothetical protein